MSIFDTVLYRWDCNWLHGNSIYTEIFEMLIHFLQQFTATASCNYGSCLTEANTGSNFTPGVVPLRHGSKVKAQVLRPWRRYSSRDSLNAAIKDCLVPRL